MFAFPSWSSKCPRSHLHPVIAGGVCVSLSRRQNLLQRTVDVDIPVLGCGGRNVGLQGFPPKQSPTAQLASQERSSERIVEQIVDSRVLGGGLQDFLPGQSSSSSSHDPARVYEALDGPGEGFFRTFPQIKKSAGVAPHSGSELAADSSPSTRRAYGVPMAVEEDESEPVTESELGDEGKSTLEVDDNGDSWVLVQSVHGPFWRNITKKRSQWHPPWRRLR